MLDTGVYTTYRYDFNIIIVAQVKSIIIMFKIHPIGLDENMTFEI